MQEEQVKALGLQDAVHFAGFQANPFAYLLHADLFVLASHYEGLGNVITEALACGVPVVATDCKSGPRELLADGKYGILSPVGDPPALAAAMKESLSMSHDHDALKTYAASFSAQEAADKYLSLVME